MLGFAWEITNAVVSNVSQLIADSMDLPILLICLYPSIILD